MRKRKIVSILALVLVFILVIMTSAPIYYGRGATQWEILLYKSWNVVPFAICGIVLMVAAFAFVVCSFIKKNRAKMFITLSVVATWLSGTVMAIGTILKTEYGIIPLICYFVLCVPVLIWNLILKNEAVAYVAKSEVGVIEKLETTIQKTAEIPKSETINSAAVIETNASSELGKSIKTVSMQAVSNCEGTYTDNGKTLLKMKGQQSIFAIPDGVTTIARNALRGYDTLRELVIPSTVKKIEIDAFPYNLQTIYYKGTKADWEKIDIDKNNHEFTVFFYGEIKPNLFSNIWRYASDGITPEITSISINNFWDLILLSSKGEKR